MRAAQAQYKLNYTPCVRYPRLLKEAQRMDGSTL
jgi:hypothetical protein